MAHRLREHLTDINAIGKELALRLAFFGHVRSPHQAEQLARLRKIDEALAEERKLLKVGGETLEESLVQRVRELEDQRFKLLSEINGDDVSRYAVETPSKNH